MFGYTNAWWMGKVRHTPRAAARPVPCAYPAPVVLPSLEVLPHTCACVQTPGWDDSVPYLTWADGEWQLPAIVGNPVTPRVRADDRNVRIIGRFLPTPIGAAFDHPGVQITTHVQGTRSVSIALSQAGAASHGTVTLSLLHRFVVFVDGVRHEGPVSFTTKNWPLHTTCVVPIASGLDPNKAHEIVVLKIVSWNIGLRGLEKLCADEDCSGTPDTHGIRRRSGFAGLEGLLEALGHPDILCLQEVKLRELGAPERPIALAAGYESYFGLCRTQTANTSFGRYAGVATFCKLSCQACRAEEGITGALTASHEAPASVMSSDRDVDNEGRCVITVHGDLAILNVYVPAVTSADPVQAARRAEYKAAFLSALERRCRSLMEEGLRVLAIGDFNVTPEPIDSARELEAAGRPGAHEPSPSRSLGLGCGGGDLEGGDFLGRPLLHPLELLPRVARFVLKGAPPLS